MLGMCPTEHPFGNFKLLGKDRVGLMGMKKRSMSYVHFRRMGGIVSVFEHLMFSVVRNLFLSIFATIFVQVRAVSRATPDRSFSQKRGCRV